MIKGISRQIIEVNQTDNEYFERAWLVIKPEYLNVGAAKLEKESERYLKNIKPPYTITQHRSLLMRFLSLLSAAVGGGVLTAAFFCLSKF